MRQVIAINAVFVGLCALLPVPFLDDVLRRVLMRGAYQAIADREGVPLPAPALDALARAAPLRWTGCLSAVAWYPIKKLSRKILYFLTVKDAIDWTAEAAVRGDLVRRALARGLLPGRAEVVRAAMDAAWKAHGGSPLTRTLLLSRHDEIDWRAEEGAAVALVGGLVRRAAAALVMRRFEEELDRALLATPALPAPADGAPDDGAPDDCAPGMGTGAPSGDAGAENGS